MFISTDSEFKEYIASLKDESYLAIDTEFMREKTYYPQLCLIQIASSRGVALIDTLALSSLAPLEPVLTNPDIVKVFHAPSQDLEIFYELFKKQVGPLFDTQTAAAFLSPSSQVGYGQLVFDLLGIKLNKADSFTDWSMRPLTKSQIAYAQEDVSYLYKLYPRMYEELKSRGRLAWAEYEFERLSSIGRYELDYDKLYLKVRRINSLKPRALAVAQRLTCWREKTAQKLDRPRKRILSDEIIIELSRRCPQSIEELKKTRTLPQLSKELMSEILVQIAEAQSLPQDRLPSLSKKQKLSYEQEITTDLLMIFVKDCAKRNQLAPTQLALRSDIENHLLKGEKSTFFTGWRSELLGDNFIQIIEGRVGLSVAKEGLALTSTEGD